VLKMVGVQIEPEMWKAWKIYAKSQNRSAGGELRQIMKERLDVAALIERHAEQGEKAV